MYRKEGGAFPDPLKSTWHDESGRSGSEDLAELMVGMASTIEIRAARSTLHAGQLLDGFAQLRDDGTMAPASIFVVLLSAAT